MTIGEKIIHLRTSAHVSQEQLAENLDVSRQSVSKWEMNQTVPQIEKLLAISDMFCISLDDLLRDEITIHRNGEAREDISGATGGNKYFGTEPEPMNLIAA